MVHVGIIGCGGIAVLRHIPALLKADHASIAGYCSRTYARAGALADKYGGKAFKTVEELLAAPEIHAVVICTPARSHRELTVKALEAGKHVLCEKPMAACAEDALAMTEAAARYEKKLMISHNQRRYEPHKKAKELLDRGEIGRILTFRTCLGIKGPEYSSVNGMNNDYFSKTMSGRGVMSDVGCHRVDLMRFLTGAEYKRVFSYTPTLEKRGPDGGLIHVDDNAMSVVEMDNGIVGSIITSWTSMGRSDRTTWLYGTEGSMIIYGESNPLVVEKKDTVMRFDFSENPEQSHTVLTDIDQIFINCIENDLDVPVSGEDGLAVVRLLDAMEQSNLKGGWVFV